MATEDSPAIGWDAIDAALLALYGNQEPKHFGTLISWRLGGKDPLDGVSAYKRLKPIPHWHFVTYGLSELYDKESDDLGESGWGFELTFRLACHPNDAEPPMWAISFLQNIARYVFSSGNVFDDGHWMSANGPIALEQKTLLESMAFVFDPELPAIDTPNGRVVFLQVVGLTLDEERAAKRWRTRSMLEAFLPHTPLWVTDIARASLLGEADVRRAIEDGSRQDGSWTGSVFIESLGWNLRKRLLRAPILEITIGARQVGEVSELLPLRLPFERPLALIGREGFLKFEPGAKGAVEQVEEHVEITMPPEDAIATAALLKPLAGTYQGPGGITWIVVKSDISDAEGNVFETVG